MLMLRSPLLVLIAGGSCSGKSHFAEKQKKKLEKIGKSSTIIPLDCYFKNLDDQTLPRNQEGRKLFDAPESYHQEEYKKAISQLLIGLAINIPDYDFVAARRLESPGIRVESADILIAEGLFTIAILSPDHPSAFKIYVETDTQTRLERRISRDTERYGVSSEVVRQNFFSKVMPCHELFVAPQKTQADFVISGA